MLEARNLYLTIGTKELFKDSSFRIGDTDKVGLVGLNGAGKSTLLKFLAGEMPSQTLHTEGQILKSASTKIGYLPQEISFEAELEKTAMEYALEANAELHLLGKKISEMEIQLAENTDHESDAYAKLIERFSEATERFDHLGGYKMQGDAEKVLIGLGFSKEDFEKKVKEFSGGWQMRLLITKLLLSKPTLLFLDEPTNHLDIDSLHWLENYLLDFDGGYIIISHDRFFLDKLTTKTLEISLKRITEYKGNYTFFEKDKAERYEIQMAKLENDQKKIEHLQKFVTRFKAKATKATQAQSRMRMIEKLQENLEAPEQDLSQISFRFPKALPSGKLVMTLEGIYKVYPIPTGGTKIVFNDLSLEINRGDRIAIVGSNGAGKSTFCKILTEETDFQGKRNVGHNVSIGYYAQHQAELLDTNKTVLQEMLDHAPDSEARKSVRDILGCFLFSGDSVEKRIGVLSGGEKSRVALAKLLLQASNLLILDEPTNHLDMRSKEMLIESLENYDGTLLIVSHDRYFLDSLVDKVFYVKKGGVKTYLNSYQEFLQKLEAEYAEQDAAAKDATKKSNAPKPAEPVKTNTQGANKPQASTTNGSASKPANGQEKSLTAANSKQVSKIESKINKLEDEKMKLESIMADADFYRDSQKSKTTLASYQSTVVELNALYAEWEKLNA
ncbi:MAG: ABC-F family ATP-binding cassette domain-containing protein [Chloroherpetonaceae bacterium]|nr:ABC-F family ATP-binding cassette domain-containing protein [Chloroherpetonaceae bacterium]